MHLLPHTSHHFCITFWPNTTNAMQIAVVLYCLGSNYKEKKKKSVHIRYCHGLSMVCPHTKSHCDLVLGVLTDDQACKKHFGSGRICPHEGINVVTRRVGCCKLSLTSSAYSLNSQLAHMLLIIHIYFPSIFLQWGSCWNLTYCGHSMLDLTASWTVSQNKPLVFTSCLYTSPLAFCHSNTKWRKTITDAIFFSEYSSWVWLHECEICEYREPIYSIVRYKIKVLGFFFFCHKLTWILCRLFSLYFSLSEK